MTRIGINTIAYYDRITQGTKQVELLPEIKTLGFDQVEIRREFLNETNLPSELKEIKLAAKKNNLTLFYSINDEFFKQGKFNQQINNYVEEAELLGAERIKLNFGSEPNYDSSDLHKELDKLGQNPIKINIENNQTKEHCNLQEIVTFFEFCYQQNYRFKFCFDLANWAWTGTLVADAVRELSSYTDYVHLKNYTVENDQLIVTSLNRGELPWQTILELFAKNIDLTLEYNGTKEMIKEDLDTLRKDEE